MTKAWIITGPTSGIAKHGTVVLVWLGGGGAG